MKVESMSEKLTYTGAAKAMRGLGFRVSRNDDGEIRVDFPGNESAAYYTDCPADALATAQDMRKRADAGAVPVADPEGEAVEAGEHTAGEPWDGPAAFDAEPVAVGGHLAPALNAAAAVWPNDCAGFAAKPYLKVGTSQCLATSIAHSLANTEHCSIVIP